MAVFEDFLKKYKPENCIEVPKAIIEKYQQRLPDPLLQLWQQQGWCAYGDGLIWLVNPNDYTDLISQWLSGNELPVVFARSAFGELLTWNGKSVYKLYVHLGNYGRMMRNIETYFNAMLVDKASLEDGFNLSLFQKALKKLGRLEADECYAFVPALAMGGSEKLENIERVKLKEHVLFLSQVHGKILIDK